AAGLNLSVSTDAKTFAEIAETFTKVTGKKAAHQYVPFEDYAKLAEPYPSAYVNWSLGPDAPRDDAVMTWSANFSAWWNYWGEGITYERDYKLLDRIHPGRIKSLEEWMEVNEYDGKHKIVLKMVEDWAGKNQGNHDLYKYIFYIRSLMPKAQADDTCTSVLAVYGYITQDQFFSWNPALDGNCQGLGSGYYYCVANYAHASNLPMPPTVTSGAFPTATGTISTFEKWYMTRVNDDCAYVAAWFGTFSVSDFISWNQSVGLPGTATTRSEALTATVPAGMPTQTGVVSSCTEFWLVSPSDTCASIIKDSNVVNATVFYSWNPAVGSDCASLNPVLNYLTV
ncbi:LysM domain-containing protein, partial [Colletotrichum tofieldiae]